MAILSTGTVKSHLDRNFRLLREALNEDLITSCKVRAEGDMKVNWAEILLIFPRVYRVFTVNMDLAWLEGAMKNLSSPEE